MAHIFSPSTWEAEASLFKGTYIGLHRQFQDCQGYTKNLSWKTEQHKRKKKFEELSETPEHNLFSQS